MNAEKTTIRIKCEFLSFGMYVSSLDRPWTETKFLFQGFAIQDEKELAELRAQCAFVYIDVELSSKESLSAMVAGRVQINSVTLSDNRKKTVPSNAASASVTVATKSTNIKKRHLNTVILFLSSLLKSSDKKVALRETFSPTKSLASNMLSDALDRMRLRNATKIRKQFGADALESDIVDYKTSKTIKEEADVALASKKELGNSVAVALARDMSASSMNETILIAKEALAEVAESISRNADAMQLIAMIKMFDEHSYQHAMDVSLMLMAFGRELCLPKADLIELGLGGLLHDIGEIKPPTNIEQRKRVKNIAKYKIYHEHVAEGLDLTKAAGHSAIVIEIIANHHERYDGEGYPKKISRGAIGLYASMAAIVDAYVSLVTGRSCDIPMSSSQALGVIMSKQGTEFNPSLVNQLAQLIGTYPVGTIVKLNSGDIGIVIKQNRAWRLKPVVMIVMNKHYEKLKSTVSVDLLIANEKNSHPLQISSEKSYGYKGIQLEDYL